MVSIFKVDAGHRGVAPAARKLVSTRQAPPAPLPSSARKLTVKPRAAKPVADSSGEWEEF